GTGILTLAALKLGATRAEGFDSDPVAVRVAGDNARRNRLPQARFYHGDVFHFAPSDPYDVVAANLYSEVLVRAADRIWAGVKPKGRLLAGGIRREQAEEVKAAFCRLDAEFHFARLRGKWVTLAFEK
ncbi:MAG: 50S ribosomal protein L11 methyltransferase, partial [Verrucomicrobia bacterium]|nr:50S ribosomal protein L11 methyltransferase [Verrucomicrobiota bacterium]